MNLFRSFSCALRGIFYTIYHERNMRIHTVVAVLAFSFSVFFEMTAEKYAILVLTVVAVIAAEMVNTSVEKLTDMYITNFDLMAKVAKDIAAGAVFIVAIASVVVGIILFWQPERFIIIFEFFACSWIRIVALVLVLTIMAIYVIYGPAGIKNLFYKKKKN